jgi:hypothetical protein
MGRGQAQAAPPRRQLPVLRRARRAALQALASLRLGCLLEMFQLRRPKALGAPPNTATTKGER